MATYKKKLKTITVHQMLDGATVEIADTASDDKATRALNEFKKYETMHYETESGGVKITNAIPYHAVQYIEVTEAGGSVERVDPYGCESGDREQTISICFQKTEGGSYRNSTASGTIGVTNFTVEVDIEYESEAGRYAVVVGELSPADTPHEDEIRTALEGWDVDALESLIDNNGCTDITIRYE